MPESKDPYAKLRAPSPTPLEDLCKCTDSPPIILVAHLSSCPLACMRCIREVSPEAIGFPAPLADELASWQKFHDCFYLLWLDSGEFKEWARDQLLALTSPVNRRGMQAAVELNEHHPAFYGWFQEGVDTPATTCPACGSPLTKLDSRTVCSPCLIVVGA
ncbi:MAG: hypothetical protein JKY61_04645 [Planctomycetes bacterium]|nr:hypothetical protein [Planctomycetota bacterium]